MDIFNFSYTQFELFILVLVRISSILVLVPVFGSRNVPLQLKVGLSLIMSIAIFPVLNLEQVVFYNLFPFVIAVAKEAVIGIVIGYVSRLIFAGVQIAGHVMGFQIGFGIVNVMDPSTASQVSILSELEYIFAVLIFLSVNAHHWILQAIVQSFDLIPLLGVTIEGPLVKLIMDLSGKIFITAIKIGAPVMAAMLFINVSLGLIARTVPQMNVFIVGFPLQIGVGLMMIGASMPTFYYLFVNVLKDYGDNLILVLRAM